MNIKEHSTTIIPEMVPVEIIFSKIKLESKLFCLQLYLK